MPGAIQILQQRPHVLVRLESLYEKKHDCVVADLCLELHHLLVGYHKTSDSAPMFSKLLIGAFGWAPRSGMKAEVCTCVARRVQTRYVHKLLSLRSALPFFIPANLCDSSNGKLVQNLYVLKGRGEARMSVLVEKRLSYCLMSPSDPKTLNYTVHGFRSSQLA
jgi:hypothetical protein